MLRKVLIFASVTALSLALGLEDHLTPYRSSSRTRSRSSPSKSVYVIKKPAYLVPRTSKVTTVSRISEPVTTYSYPRTTPRTIRSYTPSTPEDGRTVTYPVTTSTTYYPAPTEPEVISSTITPTTTTIVSTPSTTTTSLPSRPRIISTPSTSTPRVISTSTTSKPRVISTTTTPSSHSTTQSHSSSSYRKPLIDYRKDRDLFPFLNIEHDFDDKNFDSTVEPREAHRHAAPNKCY